MQLAFWIVVFFIALLALVKGADWLLTSAEKIGLAIGLSPFIIGVTIIGIGTSVPELVSGIFAAYKGATEIVAANAIGSNIANVLLIVGITAVVARVIKVKKDLINLDIPLLAISTILFLGIAWDKKITLTESGLLLATYAIYLFYVIAHKEEADGARSILKARKTRPKIKAKDIILLIVGLLGVAFGAKYSVDAVISISEIINIGAGVISMFAIAVGTSLPELIVSLKAARLGKAEVALGNIFGSNVFNVLAVVGIPGLFTTLQLDEATFSLGLPVLFATTLLFVISGISRKIHVWEGAMFIALYIFFIGKLFGII